MCQCPLKQSQSMRSSGSQGVESCRIWPLITLRRAVAQAQPAIRLATSPPDCSFLRRGGRETSYRSIDSVFITNRCWAPGGKRPGIGELVCVILCLQLWDQMWYRCKKPKFKMDSVWWKSNFLRLKHLFQVTAEIYSIKLKPCGCFWEWFCCGPAVFRE